MLLFIWLAVVGATLVLYLKELYSRLSMLGLNHLPTVPLLGNMARVVFRKEHMVTTIRKSYQAFPDDRLVGHYEFINPLVLIRDAELLKNVMVKDFEHFTDRRAVGDNNDPIFGRSLLLLKGDEWKAMRSTLSPAFTSSKIRLMVPFILEVGDSMIEHIKKDIAESKTDFDDVNVKDLATRYANDVIATCAFGLKVKSQGHDNEFYKHAREVTTVDFQRFLKFIGFRSFPSIAKRFNIRLLPKHLGDFFSTVVLGTMSTRERNNIVRHDMIHLLMEAKKGQLSHDTSSDAPAGFATVEESNIGKKKINREWSDNDLVGQAVIFLFAGFETVSTAISFLLHELALNPHVQERLLQEIRETDAKNEGKVDFNSIQNLTYLDMVVSEVLRMWPGAPTLDRVCVKDYNVGKPHSKAGKDLIIHKGQTLTIPVYSFHRDAQYFPEPDKFDPERFSEQNRGSINPSVYMPFGAGPRNCIGSRFALCEVKLMVYQLLKHVEVSPCARTCVPSQLDPATLAMRLQGGHWLRLQLRK
uniref:unspecific monooxygenase n=1 Tax=Cnaphalocrocis medinalis TaxID=437488 RepID=A0A0C5C556_CNAME|nr:cytochrome P450 monooxygenase CYP9A78 [Cnaphalocrocis medinalis]